MLYGETPFETDKMSELLKNLKEKDKPVQFKDDFSQQ